jgi:hypothetical protein
VSLLGYQVSLPIFRPRLLFLLGCLMEFIVFGDPWEVYLGRVLERIPRLVPFFPVFKSIS